MIPDSSAWFNRFFDFEREEDVGISRMSGTSSPVFRGEQRFAER